MLKSGANTIIKVEESLVEESIQGQLQLFTGFLIKITIFFNIIFFGINFFSRAFPIGINVFTLLLNIGIYYLYKSKYTKYANGALFVFYLVWISFYVCICSLNTYMVIYFAVLMAFCVTLFETDKVRVRMAILTLTVLVVLLCVKPYLPLLIAYDNLSRAYIHIFITLFVVFQSIKKYANIAKIESGKKDKLVAEVNEKNIELERFAYITSHDLKQPIRNVSNFAGLLELNVKRNNDRDKNLEYVEFIKKSSKNMESLVTDILSLSKIGSQKFDDDRLHLNSIIDASKDALKFLIKEKNANIDIGELPFVNGNELYMKLLFQNLIENAIKYNTNPNPEVKIWSTSDETSNIIYVKDNGLGIDQKYYNIVFQPFKRLHSNKEYQGSGLGLSICKKIVERHMGEISLESSESQGTLFTIKFPKSLV